LLVLVADPAVGASPLGPDASADVGGLLDKRIGDRRIGHDVAAIVIDAGSGEVLWSRQPDQLMQPASNMKIVTAVDTLATVGPAHRFPTKVLMGRGPKDVVLQGGGDPLLTKENLSDLARKTSKHFRQGTHVVLHVDGDLFPAPSRAPGWVDGYLGNSVGFVQALAVHRDRSKHPSRNAVEYFAGRLRSRGLNVRIAHNQDAAADSPVVARYRGHTAAESIARMLSQSDSGIAEVLFRQVAIAAGRPPTWAGSRRAAREVLATLGVDSAGMVLIDGSGLSRKARVSPRFLSNVLRVARVTQQPRFSAMFKPSALPVAGRTGTLGTRYGRYSTSPSRCAQGRVQAKTGTILGTIALSGIAAPQSGGERIFSVVINHRPAQYSALDVRRAVDGLAATIVGCW
jgi:D-alanyl-D-alanine carboxypeptidase/D-alanyl-D-alanine-endopeptidase (penicillin-binding protein 4)